MTRTQKEIRARYDDADDFFGFAAEVLVDSMTAETIRQINPAAQLAAGWEPKSDAEVEEAARHYLKFAIEKIVDHRGVPAERSTIKLREYAWLLGKDSVVQAMGEADYPQYGAPQVKAFADGMGWPFTGFAEEVDRPALVRMSNGEPCESGCESGCGQ